MIVKLENILRELGRELLEWRGTGLVQGVWEGAQLKTEADMRAHRYLNMCLSRDFPEIPVVSEEDAQAHSIERPDIYWLIDPIDGTASYANNFSGYVTQIALIVNCIPIVGVVYAPSLGLFYAAQLGAGAFLNGSKLHISKKSKERCILIDNYPEPRETAAKIYRDMNCTSYLESGSISLKICRIADSSADVFFKDVVVRDWDVAAPYVILKEAGGVLCMDNGKEYQFDGNYEKDGLVAATSRSLANQVSDQLKAYLV